MVSRSDVVRRFSAVRAKVADLLDRYDWVREEPDAVLVYVYWRVYDAPRLEISLPFIETKKLRLLTSPETIIRRRRELGFHKVAPRVVA